MAAQTGGWGARLAALLGGSALRTRRLIRAPIGVFRAGFGWLFADRLLMLEHVGRRSGRIRRVVLEVIGRPEPDVYVVASGFGDRAQWLKNIRANGRAAVYTATRRAAPANARILPAEEAARALTDYIARHPRTWSVLKPVFEDTLGHRIEDLGTAMPVVEFRAGSGCGVGPR